METKRIVSIALDTLYLLALSIWLGGLAMFWLVTVPAVRQGSGMVGKSVESVLNSAWSGGADWALRCGIVMLVVQFLLRRRYLSHRSRFIGDGVRQLLIFAALLLAVVPTYRHPIVDPSVSAPMIGFGIAQGALLVGVAALTVWLQLPQSGVAPVASPSRLPVK